MAAAVTKKMLKKNPSAAKKAVVKKEKRSAAQKKTAKAPSRKATAKMPEKAKKAAVEKKKGKSSPAKKPVAQKTVKPKKPQGKKEGQQERILDLRKALLRKKDDILKEVKDEIAKYISGDNRQLVDTANDDGDWAQVDISEDISLQRLSAHRKLMYNIDEALRKIAEGTYGVCEECGEEISSKRLLVLPTATLCLDCQENREQFEALESGE